MKLAGPAVMLVLFAMLARSAGAHAQAAVPSAYDVSTVKPAAVGNEGMGLNWRDAQLKAENVTLEWILTSAFHARKDQITGAPGWAREKHFDISAKLTDIDPATAAKLTADQRRALLVALLAERFGLKYHVETKEMPTYDLVPAKSGLKLTPAVNSGSDNTKQMCSGCSYWGQQPGHEP